MSKGELIFKTKLSTTLGNKGFEDSQNCKQLIRGNQSSKEVKFEKSC